MWVPPVRVPRIAVAGLIVAMLAACGGQAGRQSTPTSTPHPLPTANSRVLWGMFQDHYPPNYSTIAQNTSSLGHPTQVVHAYYSWQDNPDNRGTAGLGAFLSQTQNRGQIPLVTWEAWGHSEARIASGADDGTIDAWARAMASQKREIWLRVFHEFNIPYDPATQNGYPWSVAGGTQNTPAQLVAAWRHIHDRFQMAGASNVKFVWTPDGSDMANNLPLLQGAYPGDAYVDYTGWDTYDNYSNENAYRALTQVAPRKPAVIAEVGATNTELPFLTSLGNSINNGQMPLVRGVVWFDDGEWALQSNVATAAALRTILSGPAFRATG